MAKNKKTLLKRKNKKNAQKKQVKKQAQKQVRQEVQKNVQSKSSVKDSEYSFMDLVHSFGMLLGDSDSVESEEASIPLNPLEPYSRRLLLGRHHHENPCLPRSPFESILEKEPNIIEEIDELKEDQTAITTFKGKYADQKDIVQALTSSVLNDLWSMPNFYALLHLEPEVTVQKILAAFDEAQYPRQHLRYLWKGLQLFGQIFDRFSVPIPQKQSFLPMEPPKIGRFLTPHTPFPLSYKEVEVQSPLTDIFEGFWKEDVKHLDAYYHNSGYDFDKEMALDDIILRDDIRMLEIEIASLFDAGEYEQVEEICEEILELSEGYQPAQYNLALCSIMMGDISKGKKQIQQLQDEDTTYMMPHYAWMLLLYNEGKRSKLKKYYDDLSGDALDPTEFKMIAVVEALLFWEAGKKKKAQNMCYRLLENFPLDSALLSLWKKISKLK